MHVLAISGSLRAASLNTRLLRAVSRLTPPDVSVELYGGIGDLPLFNPDIEASDPPAVARFRARIIAADAVLIASPEYAHGVTGAMKNALDWMVGNEAFVNKPVALLNASPLSIHAQASLKEIITVMSARVVEEASIAVPIRGSGLDEDGIVSDLAIAAAIRESMQALRAAVVRIQAESPV
jgi:chromate reductase